MNTLTRLLTTLKTKLHAYPWNANARRQAPMTTEEILRNIMSRRTNKVQLASCAIVDRSQERDSIRPFIPYLAEIQSKTAGLHMGGPFAAKQRSLDLAIRILQFHKDNTECPCKLYMEVETFSPPEQGKERTY